MTRFISLIAAGVFTGSAALAHPGVHVHPHDGAHWLVMVGALSVLALAVGLGVARARSRK